MYTIAERKELMLFFLEICDRSSVSELHNVFRVMKILKLNKEAKCIKEKLGISNDVLSYIQKNRFKSAVLDQETCEFI